MKALQRRAEQVAQARQRSAIERLAGEINDRFRATQVEFDQTEIRISGRNLVKRWLSESGLRFMSDLMK